MAAQYGSAARSNSANRVFGQRNAQPAHNDAQDDDFVPAEFWLNFGTFAPNAAGEEEFYGLPRGMPLDQMKRERGRGFLANMKNGMLDQLIAHCESMEPGEAQYLPCEGSDFVIQLRRTGEAADAPAPVQNVVKLGFVKR